MKVTESETEGQAALARIAESPRYAALVRQRSLLSWQLTALMLVIYFGYVILIAFRPDILARSLDGGTTTLGIPLGIGVILAGILLTAIYVRRANGRFDSETEAILEESGFEEPRS